MMEFATAVFNEHPPVVFRTDSDPDRAAPLVATVTVRVALGFEDLVAALYLWDLASTTEMADDVTAREYLAESVANVGLSELGTVKAGIERVVPGSAEDAWLGYCRARVVELFGCQPPRPRRAVLAATAAGVAS